VTPKEDEGNPPSARHLCEDVLPDPKRRWKELPSATRMQMVRLIYLAEKSQDKWNEIINSDNNKDWKSDGCLRYLRYST
jgi:hypothetical protein